MKCPKCKVTELTPTKIEQDLPALGCNKCGGAFVSLLSYRNWAEKQRYNIPSVNDIPAATEADDTHAGLTCPKCGKLMNKYFISGALENRIDLCGSCDEAWLDNGEWELLASLELSQCMPKVFTDSWQKRVKKERTVENRRKHFQHVLGESDMKKAEHFKEWLIHHPERDEIMLYLKLELND